MHSVLVLYELDQGGPDFLLKLDYVGEPLVLDVVFLQLLQQAFDPGFACDFVAALDECENRNWLLFGVAILVMRY